MVTPSHNPSASQSSSFSHSSSSGSGDSDSGWESCSSSLFSRGSSQTSRTTLSIPGTPDSKHTEISESLLPNFSPTISPLPVVEEDSSEMADIAMRRHLEHKLRSRFSAPVSVENFVHHVWGLNLSTIGKIRAQNIWSSIGYHSMADYLLRQDIANPLFIMFEKLLDEVYLLLGDASPRPVSLRKLTVDERRLLGREGDCAQRKPKVITVPREAERAEPDWIMPWHIFEFKGDGQFRERSWQMDNLDINRNYFGELLPEYDGTNYTQDHLQLAIYAMECLAPATRHFVTGCYFDNTVFSLWYYDRSGVIRSVDIDWLKDPASLALVLYAMSQCDAKHAGFDPFFDILPGNSFVKNKKRLVGSRYIIPKLNRNGSAVTSIVKEVLYRERGLVGRSTRVYRVVQENDQEKEEKVLKMSWQPVWNQKEGKIIFHLLETLPEWEEHLPDIGFYMTLSHEWLELPRVNLLKDVSTAPSLRYHERELHILGSKYYKHLWEVDTPQELLNVWLDCVECHHQAFSISQVLHGDLSCDNLMFSRTEEGEVRGVLNDWDMASIFTDPYSIPNVSGTLPFMARDLLNGKAGVHYYRHDLESFFYILLWAALHYDLNRKSSRRTVADLEPWESGNVDHAFVSKSLFFSDKAISHEVMELIPLDMIYLIPYLVELWNLFCGTTGGFVSHRWNESKNPYDLATCGGQLTFETFMGAIEKNF